MTHLHLLFLFLRLFRSFSLPLSFSSVFLLFALSASRTVGVFTYIYILSSEPPARQSLCALSVSGCVRVLEEEKFVNEFGAVRMWELGESAIVEKEDCCYVISAGRT